MYCIIICEIRLWGKTILWHLSWGVAGSRCVHWRGRSHPRGSEDQRLKSTVWTITIIWCLIRLPTTIEKSMCRYIYIYIIHPHIYSVYIYIYYLCIYSWLKIRLSLMIVPQLLHMASEIIHLQSCAVRLLSSAHPFGVNLINSAWLFPNSHVICHSKGLFFLVNLWSQSVSFYSTKRTANFTRPLRFLAPWRSSRKDQGDVQDAKWMATNGGNEGWKWLEMPVKLEEFPNQLKLFVKHAALQKAVRSDVQCRLQVQFMQIAQVTLLAGFTHQSRLETGQFAHRAWSKRSVDSFFRGLKV